MTLKRVSREDRTDRDFVAETRRVRDELDKQYPTIDALYKHLLELERKARKKPAKKRARVNSTPAFSASNKNKRRAG